MIFKKLILKNFKSHVNSIIEFNQGTTIILGENGAGKSSVFEGINFALYKKYNTKSLNDLVNTKADTMTVTLHFLVGSTEFKVTRSRNKNKSTADLYILQNNVFNKVVSGDKEVNAHIEDLLQIDAGLFLNAIYIKQGEIDNIVTQKSSERKKNISKLLRLDNLETCYKYIPNLITNYEIQYNQLKSAINDNIETDKQNLISENKKLSLERDEIETAINQINQELKQVKQQIADQNTANITYQQLMNKKTQKITELDSIQASELRLQEEINKITQYNNVINKHVNVDEKIQLCTQLDEHQQKLQNYMNTVEELVRKRESYLQDIMRLNDIGAVYGITNIVDDVSYDDAKNNELLSKINIDIEQTEQELLNINQRLENIRIDITLLRQSLENNENMISTINKLNGTCPVCNSNINSDKKAILINNYEISSKDSTEKIQKLEQELNILVNEQKELNTMLIEKKEFRDFIQNNKLLYIEIQHCMDAESQTHASICEIMLLIDPIKKQLNIDNDDPQSVISLKNDLLSQQKIYNEAQFALKNKKNTEQEYQNVLKTKQQIQSEVEVIDNKIQNINYNANILNEKQRYETELQNQYYPMVKKIGDIESQIKYNNLALQNIDDQIRANKENKEKILYIQEFIEFLKDLREIYSKDGLQKTIRLSFRPQIQQYTQEFFAKFGFDYSNLIITDDYDIVVSGASGDSDVSMISGGEKIAIALALRLGISQAVTANKIETIMLDEPTVFLDEYRKQEFIQVIRDISLVPQLIIITHDAELVNAASSVINVEKKEGISVVT